MACPKSDVLLTLPLRYAADRPVAAAREPASEIAACVARLPSRPGPSADTWPVPPDAVTTISCDNRSKKEEILF